MAKQLIIAEKPSVAADIARAIGAGKDRDYFEGDEYVIASAVGHIVEMFNPDEETAERKRAATMRGSKWSHESLPALPERFALRPHKDAEARIGLLQRLARRRDVEGLINACDAGREGELIFHNLVTYLEVKKPVQRLWLQSMTAAAIRKSFASLRGEDATATLRAAAIARAQADWLVGINSTRALTALNSKDGGFVLTTVGRVQTPTLAFLVQRKRERDSFVSRPYWRLAGLFAADAGDWQAHWIDEGFAKDADDAHRRADRIWDEQQAIRIKDAVAGRSATVVDESRLQERRPPQLFSLSVLQREANRRFGLPANATLRSLQALYERKLVTYPRTASRHLPPDYVGECKKIVASFAAAGAEVPVIGELAGFCAESGMAAGIDAAGKRIFDAGKVTDHFAIIPTGEVPGQLNRDRERRIYELICRTFVAAFMAPAKVNMTTRRSIIEPEGGGREVFEVSGEEIIEAGWLAAAGRDAPGRILPPVADGRALLAEIEIEAGATRPPAHYTDATLLQAMEKAGRVVEDAALSEALDEGGGLGTPATRAGIIEELIHHDYMVREGRDLIPTRRADALLELLEGMEVNELTRPELTGEMETHLMRIERGSGRSEEFLGNVVGLVKKITATASGYDPDATPGDWCKLAVPCPKCGGSMAESYRKYQCENEECRFFIWKQVASRILEPAEAEQLLRTSKIGPLSGFKSKRGADFEATIILADNGKVVFDFEQIETGDISAMESIGACPKCDSKVRAGQRSFFCESATGEDKKCDFSIRRQMLDRELAADEIAELLASKKTSLLEGFVSRKPGKRRFSAYLTLDDSGKIGFAFEERKPRKPAAGSRKYTAGRRSDSAGRGKYSAGSRSDGDGDRTSRGPASGRRSDSAGRGKYSAGSRSDGDGDRTSRGPAAGRRSDSAGRGKYSAGSRSDGDGDRTSRGPASGRRSDSAGRGKYSAGSRSDGDGDRGSRGPAAGRRSDSAGRGRYSAGSRSDGDGGRTSRGPAAGRRSDSAGRGKYSAGSRSDGDGDRTSRGPAAGRRSDSAGRGRYSAGSRSDGDGDRTSRRPAAGRRSDSAGRGKYSAGSRSDGDGRGSSRGPAAGRRSDSAGRGKYSAGSRSDGDGDRTSRGPAAGRRSDSAGRGKYSAGSRSEADGRGSSRKPAEGGRSDSAARKKPAKRKPARTK